MDDSPHSLILQRTSKMSTHGREHSLSEPQDNPEGRKSNDQNLKPERGFDQGMMAALMVQDEPLLFHGERGENVNIYTRRCELRWSSVQLETEEERQQQQCMTLYLGLRGDARKFMEDKIRQDFSYLNDFPTMCSALSGRFPVCAKPRRAAIAAAWINRVMELSQGASSFDDYCAEGIRLMHAVPEGESYAEALADRWAKGLRSKEAASAVWVTAGTTRHFGRDFDLTEAIEVARGVLELDA